jgi:hypothetical protein
MPKPLREQATLLESVDKKTGKILVDIITPGVGTSGYYSPEVCEAAAGLVTAGTQMFLDHPTEAESYERPGRSVKDIAAVFTEPARWDPDRGEAGALVAEAQVVPGLVETMGVIQGAIGVSIWGSATDIVEGEVDGRRQRIIEGLHDIQSVDFVTRAGRGGAFALMESANPSRVHARAISHGVAEATVNDTREALQTVLRDAYGGEKVYVWVRDFDDSTVWFEVEDGDNSGVYGQPYSSSDGVVDLSGDRTEVRVSTTYVPVTRPDSNTTTATESQEDTMPKIQIEESEHTRLTETAGRVPTLEAERDTAVAERDEARGQLFQRDITDRARSLIGESEHVFTPLEARGLLVNLPVVEAEGLRVLDETAFVERLTEASKESAAALGSKGGLHGFGASTSTDPEVAESGRPTNSPWGRPLAEQKGA